MPFPILISAVELSSLGLISKSVIIVPESKEKKPGLIKKIWQNVSPFKGMGAPEPRAKIQTPPLGNTPMPKLTQNTQQKHPQTNLTRTETALLSPTEKVIAERT